MLCPHRPQRAVALMVALLAAALFGVLAITLLGQFAHQYMGERRQQQLVQARWNARSGVDLFFDSGQLPNPDPTTQARSFQLGLGGSNSCQVVTDGNDLVFEGSSGTAQVWIRCLGGDPTRTFEQVASR